MRLLQFVPWAVVALSATLLANAGQAAAQELRYKFNAGEKLQFNMTQNMTMSLTGEGLPAQKTSLEQITEMSWNVEEVKDGTAQIGQSIDRIKMSLAAPNNVSFDYDSASEEEPTGNIANMMAPVLDAMVGATFDVTMNPRGEILEIQVPETLTQAMQKLPNAAAMGDMFSKEGFEKLVQQGSLTFPEGELESGHEWENSIEMQNPALGGKQTVTTKYRYLGQEEVDGQMLDAFAITVNMDFGQGAGPAGAKMSIKDQESSGKIYFDREAGHMKSSSVDMTMNMEITAFGRTLNSQLKQNVKVDVKEAEK
jgi:hypothetical protein